jgi:protein-arginine kinase activator protein McsA
MLCQSCHQHEAACHNIEIVDGVEKARDLCLECFEKESSQERLERLQRLRASGGSAVSGWTNYDPKDE